MAWVEQELHRAIVKEMKMTTIDATSIVENLVYEGAVLTLPLVIMKANKGAELTLPTEKLMASEVGEMTLIRQDIMRQLNVWRPS